MLSDRIIKVLDTMNVTISDVARAGGCTPSNLNRVKNGVRTPPPSSPTIRHLVTGLMEIAQKRQLSGELCSLCGAKVSDDKDSLRIKLIEWFFEDEPPYVRSYQRHPDREGCDKDRLKSLPSTEFSKRLDSLMQLSDLSNRRLGQMSGLDPSYISRLRRGERIPRYHSPYLIKICLLIRDEIAAAGKLSDLSVLTSLTEAELSGAGGAEQLRRWLFGYGTVTGYLAADELMGTIASIDKRIKEASFKAPEEYDIEKILQKAKELTEGTSLDDEVRYIGINGLRSAVTRFLAEMIQNGEREMYLYSDQSMDWMGGEYRPVLTTLMACLVSQDVKVRIIHTLDRSMSELIAAVDWWMPLYLTGKIESYYCLPSAGKRFSHTLFIRPGAACIAGTSAIGLESRAVYNYSPDHEMSELAEETFLSILKDSLPLVQICEYKKEPSEQKGFVITGDVMVKAAPDQVSIQRVEAPFLMFTFTHPMICRAFGAYMENLNP